MNRTLLSILFAACFMVSVPVMAETRQAIEIIDNDFDVPSISIMESTLRVTGANGQVLYIYNVAGVCVQSVKIDGNDKRIELNLPKGCYIIKVGKLVRKISIK